MIGIGSVKEDLTAEKRISITPETVKRLTDLNLSVFIEKSYGEHLRISDDEYKNEGASLKNSAKEVLEKSEIILKVSCPSNDEINLIKNRSILIGQFDLLSNKEMINKLIRKNVKVFSLNLLPRITRAQPMDVLSSQANLAGYRAVIESVEEFDKAVPMMMTAAGTITPAKIMVIGAGVAGLQAIATAKRLGAIVSATDVRTAAKEQVESLGGKFVIIESDELKDAETAGGYAKEMSEDFKKQQAELISNTLANQDIAICTALIPGKKAPTLITEKNVMSMKPGSVIIDLAAQSGGNCELSKPGETVEVNGVSSIGATDFASDIPQDASALYSKNMLNFMTILFDAESGELNIDWEDEIIINTALTKEGAFIHKEFI